MKSVSEEESKVETQHERQSRELLQQISRNKMSLKNYGLLDLKNQLKESGREGEYLERQRQQLQIDRDKIMFL